MENYKEIKEVSLNTPNRKDPMSGGAIEVFDVTPIDGDVFQVPTNPENRHYWMVREWYLAQKKKPFYFEFEDIPEAKPEVASEEDGSGLALSATQTEDADLPDINLTKAQIKELDTNSQK